MAGVWGNACAVDPPYEAQQPMLRWQNTFIDTCEEPEEPCSPVLGMRSRARSTPCKRATKQAFDQEQNYVHNLSRQLQPLWEAQSQKGNSTCDSLPSLNGIEETATSQGGTWQSIADTLLTQVNGGVGSMESLPNFGTLDSIPDFSDAETEEKGQESGNGICTSTSSAFSKSDGERTKLAAFAYKGLGIEEEPACSTSSQTADKYNDIQEDICAGVEQHGREVLTKFADGSEAQCAAISMNCTSRFEDTDAVETKEKLTKRLLTLLSEEIASQNSKSSKDKHSAPAASSQARIDTTRLPGTSLSRSIGHSREQIQKKIKQAMQRRSSECTTPSEFEKEVPAVAATMLEIMEDALSEVVQELWADTSAATLEDQRRETNVQKPASSARMDFFAEHASPQASLEERAHANEPSLAPDAQFVSTHSVHQADVFSQQSKAQPVVMDRTAFQNPGSLGHPRSCSRPCRYFAIGACNQGASCKYCHFGHPQRRPHLDKRHREQIHGMPFSSCFALLLPVIHAKMMHSKARDAWESSLEILLQLTPIEHVGSGQDQLRKSLSALPLRTVLTFLYRSADSSGLQQQCLVIQQLTNRLQQLGSMFQDDRNAEVI
eukprot:TRINITY_DN21130_c0_g1_i1.p1 TRINITY_DN21130_c0_g1~~TRINITY_DN21130_c0_g1_i1.p1  ORF type:complete len:605 (-),score=104.88 TRINITY_DN21130_c0_g1_i1:257-2071(-)